jgi:hypothetical protein
LPARRRACSFFLLLGLRPLFFDIFFGDELLLVL